MIHLTPLIKSALLIGALSAVTACSQAHTAPVKAETKTTVKTMEWAAKYVTAAQASALLSAAPEMKVLDIRTPGEINQGHIKDAVFADFKAPDFAAQLSKLDRHTPYIVHCRSGGRSTKSLTTLKELGFTNITHMDGGILGWTEAGLPLVMP